MRKICFYIIALLLVLSPSMVSATELSENNFNENLNNIATSNNNLVKKLENQIEEENNSQAKTYCKAYATPKGSLTQYTIYFKIDSNGQKIYEIKANNDTNKEGSANYNEPLDLERYVFKIDDNMYDVFWSDNNIGEEDESDGIPKCAEPIYFKSGLGYLIISNKKSSIANGSKDDSTGYEDYNYTTAGSSEDENKDQHGFNPGELCQGDNCNISLENFCYLPTVSRTMKFIGLGLFILKILVPAIIIIMGVVNLFKIITSGKMDDAKKYGKTIIRNIIIGIIIFLAPGIIDFVFTSADNIISPDTESSVSNCEKCLLDPTDENECIITNN